MKKIDHYIIRKFLGTFFYAIALLIVIVIVFDLSEKIDNFLKTKPSVTEILFSYYLNFIPYFVNLFVYLFTFISVIFFTSKMASNTEIIAMLSSGISFNRLLRPYFIAAVFLAGMSLILSNFVIPYTNRRLQAFEDQYLHNPRSNRDTDIHMKLDQETYAYVESFNAQANVGYKFAIEKINEQGLYYKLTSEKVQWDSATSTWKAQNYYLRQFRGEDQDIRHGREISLELDLKPEEFTIKKDDMKTMNFIRLNEFIKEEKLKGSQNLNVYLVEKYKRIADPFATLILTFIAVSVSSRKVRGGIGMHLGIGIAITFSYIMFIQVSTVFATMGNLSPAIGAWIPNLIFGIMALFMIRLAPK
ncbi:MAG TPA: LptF/LptG family permease [Bacteroidales bacterium]|nr:LptF/LptG family permease [Bacteroidales bacterium]